MEEKKVGDYDEKLSLVWDGFKWIDWHTAMVNEVPYSGRVVSSWPEFKVLEYHETNKAEMR